MSPPVRWLTGLARGRSIKRRLVVMFLVLAVVLTGVFAFGAQRAFSVGWRDAARPLLADYVDRLAADITGPGGGPPNIARAQALTERLPITVRIDGPVVRWASHPASSDDDDEGDTGRWSRSRDATGADGDGGDVRDASSVFERRTADGHRLTFGMNRAAFERRPRLFGVAIVALLLITLAAYLYVRRLLRPLDDIAAGAHRFGGGDFARPIPVRHPTRPDELDQLARTVNTMGADIGRMLEAKRALLLAISHELRSPLTRARLHAELLPETGDTGEQRAALLRDLQDMATLVGDLLESERLAGRHVALHREAVDLPALAHEVIEALGQRHAAAAAIEVRASADLPSLPLDRARIRLLLTNLLDNALRHGAGARPPTLTLAREPGGGVVLEVRDHGPGVPDDQLARLAQAFYRPDGARTRAAGGVGLGLYLCRLVTEAHGGTFTLRLAHPGLAASATLPVHADPSATTRAGLGSQG